MDNQNFTEIENQSLRTHNYELFVQVGALQEEIKQLRSALEYYANKDIYFESNDNAVEFDQGETARKALAPCK